MKTIPKAVIYILLIFLSSCEIINPNETIPAFIEINEIVFDTQSRGSNSHNIVNVWVYADEEFLGVFEYPCRIPVLRKGETTIKVEAGIYSDGIRSNRIAYPFYSTYNKAVTLVENETVVLKPEFSYKPEVVYPFPFYEDFEDGISSFDSTYRSLKGVHIFPADTQKSTYTGFNIGMVTFTTATYDHIYEVTSITEFTNSVKGQTFYMEFDYKSDLAIKVGIYSDGQIITDLTLNPNNKWTKVYVPLMDEIGRLPSGAKFKILLAGIQSDQAQGYVSIDNVKVVTF